MKKSILTLIITLLFFSAAYGENQSKWIYVVHYSALSKEQALKVKKSYDCISLTGWEISSKGVHENSSAAAKFKMLIESGMSLNSFYPLIAFSSRYEGIKILSDKKKIKKAAQDLSGFALKNSFRNIHLDFEYIPPVYAEALGHFLKEIRSVNSELNITMAVFPQIDFPENLSKFHRPDIISKHLDGIVLMCYDYRKDSPEAGPITDISWADKNIEYILKFFSADRVYLGMPAYGYSWIGKGKNFAVTASASGYLKKNGRATRDKSGCIKIDYIKDGISHKAYISDEETISRLEGIASKYRLKGSALWRYGFLAEHN